VITKSGSYRSGFAADVSTVLRIKDLILNLMPSIPALPPDVKYRLEDQD
jgi:hypothetical protein